MRTTPAMHTELSALGDVVGVPELASAVHDLIDVAVATVPSCLALRITSPALGPAQTIQTAGISVLYGDARASLRLDLLGAPPGPGRPSTLVRVLILASQGGVFADFVGGADPTDRQGFRIVQRTIDEDLFIPGNRAPPTDGPFDGGSTSTLTDGFAQHDRVVNRAVGVLMGRGHPPDLALELLHHQAATAHRTVLDHARALLQSTVAAGDGV
jgi:hypothetical protein